MTQKILTAAALAVMLAWVSPALAFQTAAYRAIVTETIQALSRDSVDIDGLIEMQRELIDIGIEGARNLARSSPDDSRMVEFVIESIPAMTAMDLDQIEEAWHEGGAFRAAGIAVDDIDHFGPVISHMDTIVHPATAIVALRTYEETGNPVHLLQVKDELSEVIEHLSAIE